MVALVDPQDLTGQPSRKGMGREMTASEDTIMVNATVEITTTSLQTIVQNAKKITGPDAKGVYRVDTADMVSEMISRFLLAKDFEGYVKDIENYTR